MGPGVGEGRLHGGRPPGPAWFCLSDCLPAPCPASAAHHSTVTMHSAPATHCVETRTISQWLAGGKSSEQGC